MLDAAGKVPHELTDHERKWRDNIDSGQLAERFQMLNERQAMPLSGKIELSLQRIREWYEAFDGNIAVSFSGGKDSSVLLWLVRQIYPDIPAVFCNTGLEYPEILNMVKQTANVTVMRPKIPFHHIIRDFGWPVISKKVARGINILRNPTGCNQNIWRLYDQGINRFGEPVNGFKVPARWRFLVQAPFKISDKCCHLMKKAPMARYEKTTGRAQIVGMMATDSKIRQKTYLQTGCNAYDAKHPRSMPMGFWTEQDVINCIKTHKIPYAAVYGDIKTDRSGKLHFSGVSSTGCIYCCFGLHMEGSPNRFQMMQESHPHLYNFCMDKLGLGDVIDYMRDHCPDRSVSKKFNRQAYVKYEQAELF